MLFEQIDNRWIYIRIKFVSVDRIGLIQLSVLAATCVSHLRNKMSGFLCYTVLLFMIEALLYSKIVEAESAIERDAKLSAVIWFSNYQQNCRVFLVLSYAFFDTSRR